MAAEFVTHELYNGEVKVRFYPNSHRYKLEGERGFLTSVTAVTGLVGGQKTTMLMEWALTQYQRDLMRWLETAQDPIPKMEIEEAINNSRDAAKREKERTAEVGDIVHNYAEEYGAAKKNGNPVPKPPENQPAEVYKGIKAFLTWVRDNKVEFIETERLVYSKKRNFVGTMDLLANVNGELTVVDYKTGKRVYEEHQYQLAAYKMAWVEETGDKITKQMILHFDRETGMCEAHPITLKENNTNRAQFQHLLAVKEDLKAKARKK